MAHADAHDPDKYYIPHGSRLPFFGAVALFILLGSAALLLNESSLGGWGMLLGLALVVAMFVAWFGTVIRESQAGTYNLQVDRSFRMGMVWFIYSEVMFFACFFGVLFYARVLALSWLGGEGAKSITGLLWPDFDGSWPSNGPAHVGPRDDGTFEVIPALGLPAINTAILLTSGVTITIAHQALKAKQRGVLNIFLGLTWMLGFLFVGLQAQEYAHAYHELGLQLGTGIYGSTFFLLTGFHGLHVTVGAIMLLVIWFRCLKGHFTPERHFAFEGVAWYWHFVDVVWLGLFIFVYWV